MGSYTNNLFKKNRRKPGLTNEQAAVQQRRRDAVVKIIGCAIKRDNVLYHEGGYRAHADIRKDLKDEEPYKSTKGDEEGFMTSEGNFVNRWRATHIAYEAGQITFLGRELLSSDIDVW